LSVLSQQDLEATVKASQQKGPQSADRQPRSVQPYSFRSAGRMSNENARALTAMHETFARHLAVTLEDHLGTELGVKLKGLDQVSMQEHIANIPALNYVVSFSPRSAPCAMFIEFDLNVAFPIIERLLGGAGSPVDGVRELSELEEEIMLDVTSLIARTSMPAVDNARTADSRPEPGPLTRTSTTRSPLSPALLAAVMAACWAANGVPLREPRNPRDPELDHAITFPV